jgi:adenosylmethionine-8-amino-7-oxononanoate aminotransferase
MEELRNTVDIDKARADAKQHFWPHSQQAGDMSKETGVQLITRSQGVWVEDADGERWFDTLSGLWLVNIGHGRREIADAVYRQMLELGFSPNGTVSPVTAALSAKLAEYSGDDRARVYYVSGGSEANETALKIAKNYHHLKGEPNRWKVLSRRGSYHGATLACTSLGRGGPGGGSVPAQFGPLVPGNVHVAQSAQYRCPMCSNNGNCNLECAADIERAILHEGPSTVAAFIAEPISAAAGIHIPHPGYWPEVRRICDRYGVLLIGDEVITGFGRTGKMFALDHWGVKPDIRTVAKGLTSGYVPIGAAIVSGSVANAFIGANDTTFQHLITFGGNPVSCAAALANLQIMEDERLAERSAEMGEYLYDRLKALRGHPIVGDIRGGKGLLCALELVKNRDTGEQFPKEAKLDLLAVRAMRANRMLGRAGNIIPIAPPLCISREEIDEAVSRLDRVLASLEAELFAIE